MVTHSVILVQQTDSVSKCLTEIINSALCSVSTSTFDKERLWMEISTVTGRNSLMPAACINYIMPREFKRTNSDATSTEPVFLLRNIKMGYTCIGFLCLRIPVFHLVVISPIAIHFTNSRSQLFNNCLYYCRDLSNYV